MKRKRFLLKETIFCLFAILLILPAIIASSLLLGTAFAVPITALSGIGAYEYVGNTLASPLPDTGQTKCYDNDEEIPCPEPAEDFYGQDANYLINPPSYTKLDANGNDLADSATSWVMVRDNVTGMIWEVKTDDGSIHDKDNVYNWQEAQDVFIVQVNASSFGGHSDWRLPTIKELASILNFGRYPPAIDTEFFPDTPIPYNFNFREYWSGSTHANNSDRAWAVSFNTGGYVDGTKTRNYYVRCVRGGPAGSFDSLIINGDGTVTDSSTGLMWQQDTAPETYWEEALSYSESLTLAGYDDWRLPNQRELQSIVDYGTNNPAIDTEIFPYTNSSLWSSSTTAGYSSYAWYVYFPSGYVHLHNKTLNRYVRCVRGGQARILDHLVILTPAQASSWYTGDSMAISWATQSISGNVKIFISRQGGKDGTFETIAESTENDGSYNWAVTGAASVNCVLKIEPIDDSSKGTTQGLFAVYSPPDAPTVTTGAATSATSTSATLNGTVNPNGASTTVVFKYGTNTSYGSTVTATQSPLIGVTAQHVSASLAELTPETTYHFRVKATNSVGTIYGDDQTFTTSSLPPTVPSVTTGLATSVTAISATLNGTVNPNGITTAYYFQYGTTTSYGSTTTSTSAGAGTSNVSANASLTALSPSTIYHYRLVATNSAGTADGSDQTLTTVAFGATF